MKFLELTGSLKDLLDNEKPAITPDETGFTARGLDYSLSVKSDTKLGLQMDYNDCAVQISINKADQLRLKYTVENGYAASQIEVLKESKTRMAAELLRQLRADSRSSAHTATIDFSDVIKLLSEQIKYQKLISIQ